ncbi:hypothetical protein JRO89_XS06G0175400 [Xanthoceras sorbifolium]|uniref:Gnk2-homologous domain-containing protein n=1 Tax=Xanthoceras sorbifolium TaxID=99658 RepID=A0ABQ8HYT9_9ROSI|nr:hypothetical protein JRO89_XS06G0175400 [Xanthoceras sorbifolium]
MQLILLYYLITCLCYPANANLNDITSGDPPYNICAKSNNYATDSPFKINLYNLFGIFSSNASVTKFSSFYTGDDSDRVYGLYMCFSYNYTTHVDCSNCIATMASQHIVKYCPNKKEAIVWEDSCLLHYSSENFFGKLDVTGNIPKANSQNVSDPESYRSVVNRTLSTLTNEAAFNPANDMSATGVEHFSKTETLYALVQCTRDLSGDDCSLCLQTATREILSCCYFLRGARVHSRSCFLRYELYDFSNGATDSSVSAGNQAKGQGKCHNFNIYKNCLNDVAFVLGALLACTIYYLTKKKGARASGGLRLVESHDIDCPNTRVYTPNSTYEHDLKLLLQSLSSNTSLNAGFYNSSVGDDTNRVYSQALCRGDVNHTACQNCIENAIQDILKNCSNEDAIIWHDLCQIHYSSQNFFSINTGYYGKFPTSNDQRRRISDSVRLTKVLKYLMNDITVEASDSPLKFAVGQINFLKSDNIYGLAQCTRDISTSYCYNCLGSALSELIAHCGDLEGGIVVDSNCNVRFELYRFYNGSSISLTYQNSAGEDILLSVIFKSKPKFIIIALFLSLKEGGKWTIGMVVGIICISIVILLVLIGSCFVYLKWKSRAQTDEASSQLVLIHNLARPTTVSLTQEGDFAWQLWKEGKELEFVDPFLMESCTSTEILRCIQIGLLCVQEDPASRPTMSYVVALLGSDQSIVLPEPRQPAISVGRIVRSDERNGHIARPSNSILKPYGNFIGIALPFQYDICMVKMNLKLANRFSVNANRFSDIYDSKVSLPYNICSITNHYAADSPFQNNLKSLFKTLSSDASVTKFSNSSTGNDMERVYGLYMCLNYKSIDDCNRCIATTSDIIFKVCPNQKEAVMWQEFCMLRYSNENFFGQLDVSVNFAKANIENVSKVDFDKYRSVVNRTLSDLRKRAASDPANNMYAIGKAPLTDKDTLYALVQCTGDLSADDCNSCLQTATIDILSCCSILLGARLHSRSCFLRYELYEFTKDTNDSSVPAENEVKGKGKQPKQDMDDYSSNNSISVSSGATHGFYNILSCK